MPAGKVTGADVGDELRGRSLDDASPESPAPAPWWRRYGPDLLADRRALRVGFDTAAYLVEVMFNTSHISDMGCSYRLFSRRMADYIAETIARGLFRKTLRVQWRISLPTVRAVGPRTGSEGAARQ